MPEGQPEEAHATEASVIQDAALRRGHLETFSLVLHISLAYDFTTSNFFLSNILFCPELMVLL